MCLGIENYQLPFRFFRVLECNSSHTPHRHINTQMLPYFFSFYFLFLFFYFYLLLLSSSLLLFANTSSCVIFNFPSEMLSFLDSIQESPANHLIPVESKRNWKFFLWSILHLQQVEFISILPSLSYSQCLMIDRNLLLQLLTDVESQF